MLSMQAVSRHRGIIISCTILFLHHNNIMARKICAGGESNPGHLPGNLIFPATCISRIQNITIIHAIRCSSMIKVKYHITIICDQSNFLVHT